MDEGALPDVSEELSRDAVGSQSATDALWRRWTTINDQTARDRFVMSLIAALVLEHRRRRTGA
jgi:hypothetical protein